MQLRAALASAIQKFAQSEVGSPRLNAETLLMFTLGCERAYLYAHPERELTADEQERFEHAAAERARGVPAQYITGHQEFWGLDLIVTPAVLIPRPETEHVVEAVLALARWKPQSEALRMVDVGTGSGCIALALAVELPTAQIVATDISAEALAVAAMNCARLNLSERVQLRQGDLLAGFAEIERFDLIVCNPPYVSNRRPETVQKQVREFEPAIAVFSGDSGLEIYERLIPQARARLQPAGWLVMEIGYSIEPAVRSLLAGWREIKTTPDLQGLPRVITAQP